MSHEDDLSFYLDTLTSDELDRLILLAKDSLRRRSLDFDHLLAGA